MPVESVFVKPLRLLVAAISLSVGAGIHSAVAAEPEAAPISGGELAAKLSAKQQDGNALIRLKMDGPAGTLQIQIKSRAGRGGAELVYQVLWPKERKGEAVLLRRGGGFLFTPPSSVKPIDSMSGALLGSDLSYEDVTENFFAWDQQNVVGTEQIDRVNCPILESKPGKGRSAYASVRTWVDTRRMVPLRIEKYGSGGKLIRRIDTTKVASDDRGRPIPANLSVRGPRGSVTELDGSKIRHGVNFSDREFSEEGFGELTPAQNAQE